MKLSVVIVCWNGINLIGDCLQSIFAGTKSADFEIIIVDNGSKDDSVPFVRQRYPQARVIENGANLGYAKGNNVAIPHCRGQYVLLLNSDTIVHPGALDELIAFADGHPNAGAFGCSVLNSDGSPQISARPFPTIWRDWLDAFWIPNTHSLRSRLWHSGCCLMLRADLLRRLQGFDERFFYSYEDVDLCWRVWESGHSVANVPLARVTHLGRGSANRDPLRFEIERHRSRYLYFFKHHGAGILRSCRTTAIVRMKLRHYVYAALNFLFRRQDFAQKAELYRAAAEWNRALNPVRFVEHGEEPAIPAHWEEPLLPRNLAQNKR